MRPEVKRLYDRYVAALHGVTGGGTWIDHAATSLALWLALEELDAHHVGINPATNGSIGRWRKLEEDLLNWLDGIGADGEYADDPVAAVRRMFDARDANIIKLAECVDAQAAIIADLRAQLEQQRLAVVAPTVHVNGDGPKPEGEPGDNDNYVTIAPQAQAMWKRIMAAAPVMDGRQPAAFRVDAIDEVDYPPAAPIADAPAPAATLPPVRINWLGLPHDLQAHILRLEDGTATWRSLPNPDRRAITLYAIPRVGSPAISMSEWLASKPEWMPTASALAQMFGLRWTELVANAHRVATE